MRPAKPFRDGQKSAHKFIKNLAEIVKQVYPITLYLFDMERKNPNVHIQDKAVLTPQTMINDSHYVECTALEMIGQFGAGAAHIARALAQATDEAQDDMLPSAETWRDIVDAIEQSLTKSVTRQHADNAVNKRDRTYATCLAHGSRTTIQPKTLRHRNSPGNGSQIVTSFVEFPTIGSDFGCTPLRSMNHAAVLLRDLPAYACRWPFGDPHDAGFHWCGKRTDEGSYCEEHRAEARNPEQHVPRIRFSWMIGFGGRR